ncbi:hypothetical protein AB0M43_36630 [Longispora sp. NPDC051575]|uniref:hypothetical protein n=1 Tax=Longispora sp. NPDC051575 TaxID=3154943 RepID=UPI00341598BC
MGRPSKFTVVFQIVAQLINWASAAMVNLFTNDLWWPFAVLSGVIFAAGVGVTLLADRQRQIDDAESRKEFVDEIRSGVEADQVAVRPEREQSLLAQHTAQAVAGIRGDLGKKITLSRDDAKALLTDISSATLLSGPSGCGKTVLAKDWLMAAGGHQRLWLSAQDLDNGLTGFGTRLGLRRPLENCLAEVPGKVRIVVDGLDRSYSDAQFASVAALARAAVATGGRIQLLVTSQQMETSRVGQRLIDANAPELEPITMENLSEADLQLVLIEHPDLARMAIAGRFFDLLRRPKILDLVLGMPGQDVAGIQDEASVAELWWQRRVLHGRDPAVRQELLLGLAVDQADRLRPWTPTGDLGAAQAASADRLRADGILAEDHTRYTFAHDLFDDWALLQYLRTRGDDAIEVIALKAGLPSWHRAIRLHAAGVLREHGVTRWNADRVALNAADEPLVADLYLDAVFYAHDAGRLLGELWPRLAGDSALLVRLLRRFLFSATVPDSRWIAVVADMPEYAVYSAAQSRLPVWPLWLPVLRVLAAEHETAVASAAPEVAAIADLWLRRAPDTWPVREQAAVVGLAVGQHIVAHLDGGGFFDDKVEQVLWRCVIAAGSVEPDAVAALIDPLLPAVDNQPEHGGRGAVRRRRGQAGLRAALLDVDTVMPLLPQSAQLARDLVLRAAVDPDRRQRHRLRDGFGVVAAPRSFDPIPESGPFRAMLVNAEPQGVDVVVSLVEYATTHWARARTAARTHSTGASEERPAFEVLLDGAPVTLVGDGAVLGWSHGGHQVPDILAAAMMALEAHLYRALDEGRDITAILVQLTGSRSVAVWGLLADVARHTPALLEGPLAPVISSADILDQDQMDVEMRLYRVFSLPRDPNRAMRARDWHTMDHRKTPILHLVRLGAFVSGALTEQLTAARAHWAATDAHRLRVILAATDSANYRTGRTPGGTAFLEYNPPPALQEEALETRASLDVDRSGTWMTFAHTMRSNITQQIRPVDADLEEQWATVQPQLDALAPDAESPSSISGVEDLRCGYAAWLVLCARDWLRAHPDREAWCRAALLRPLTDPTAVLTDVYPDNPSDHEWDGFCADALIALLAEDPENVDVRAAVARLLLVPRRLTITTVMRLVAAHPNLADDVLRLEHLTLHWARLSMWRNELGHNLEEADDFDFEFDPQEDDGPDEEQDDEPDHDPGDGFAGLETACEAAFDAFADGSLPVDVPRLAAWFDSTPVTRFPADTDARTRMLRTLDLDYLIAARPHFTGQNSTADPRVVEVAGDLADFVATGLAPTTATKRFPRHPYQAESHALDLLADVTVNADPAQARTIWEPILALGGTAAPWVEHYLDGVWKTACAKDTLPAAFLTLVSDMLAAADTWQGHRSTGVLALAVAGLSEWGRSPVTEQQTAALRAAVPAWTAWFGDHMAYENFAYSAAHFFQKPATAAFVHDAVRWFADRERSTAPRSDRLDTAVTELLVTISARTPNPLRGTGPTADNGRHLLARLHGRSSAVAGQLLISLT